MPPLLRDPQLLEDERGLHVVTLSMLMLRKYGPEYLLWPYEAFREQLEEDFGSIGILTWERVQAVRVLHTHSFWTEWEVFEKVTAAVVGAPPVFSYVQPPEAEDVAIALTTAARFDSYEFSPDVLSYMVAALLHDGTWYLEPPLNVAQPTLDAFDARKGISRDTQSVALRLQQVSDYIQEPETAADVQVNNVLSVRKALVEYNESLNKQLQELL